MVLPLFERLSQRVGDHQGLHMQVVCGTLAHRSLEAQPHPDD